MKKVLNSFVVQITNAKSFYDIQQFNKSVTCIYNSHTQNCRLTDERLVEMKNALSGGDDTQVDNDFTDDYSHLLLSRPT